MKKKAIPFTAALLAAVLIGTFAAGCGSSSKSTSYSAAESYVSDGDDYALSGSAYSYEADTADYAYEFESAEYDEVTTENLSAEVNAAAENSGAETEQKLIYTASLDLETTDFDAALADLASLTDELGGYYESSSQGSYSGGCRYMSVTVRIPAENYRTFLDRTGELCHVLYQSEYTEDVSEMYYDVAGRLETQQIKLARLQELLEQAEDMEDIIALEDAISQTEEIIDSYTGELRHYDALVDYSTVDISLEEVLEETPEPDADPTFGQRLGTALSGGIRGLVVGVQGFLVVLAYIWPWLLIAAGVVVLIVVLRRRSRPKREARRAERKARRAAKRAEKIAARQTADK